MTQPPLPDDDLLARYREASALAGDRPDPQLRAAVLAQAQILAWRYADAGEDPTLARSGIAPENIAGSADGTPAEVGFSSEPLAPMPVEAANDRHWRIPALASVAVLGLAGLLALQFDRGPPHEQAVATGRPPAASAAAEASLPLPAPQSAPAPETAEAPKAEPHAADAAPSPDRAAPPAPPPAPELLPEPAPEATPPSPARAARPAPRAEAERAARSARPATAPTDKTAKFVCVDIAADKPLKKPVPLEAIKTNEKLTEMDLVKYSRLSVQSVTPEQWKLVCKMGGI